ncbi:MAG: hypothetical protein E7274_01305 [Pseudobutyrivibrio ruminis]|uniref:prolyl oligopeptidase family serine peptidase n=1 Tax=Pseudobutyrivibrio ruminis TaxID=46206 RepID=UPI0026F23FF8|nr:hypothetical protein [Pseudobutyrivibrio ruminis]MBE5912681.1 hypothetical protein [Pseudobutyrivibrio ruminis]
MLKEQNNIVNITAIASVTPVGQKCVAALLEYEKVIKAKEVSEGTFEVKNRTIEEVKVTGNKVLLSLSLEDEAALVFHNGNPWANKAATLDEIIVSVIQKKPIIYEDGTVAEPFDEYQDSNKSYDEIADQFIQGSFGKQKYNLFIPRDYDPTKKYPIVQFIHDAAVCGNETRLAITQGVGATIWASEEEQKKHPCFVLAPQFDLPAIVDDDWNVDKRLEDAKAALDYVIETYSIDTERIYTTGQSMGCMSSIVLNVRYPDFFAGSLLVAGQWNERSIHGLEKQNLWMICSQGDAKAFPIMNQMCVVMEKAGAKVSRYVMENNLSNEQYAKIAEDIYNEKPNIIFTPFKLETVANGWHSNGGEHHMSTWQTAYCIEAIRDWLFAQRRGG